ncbi:general stress protein [Peribacillus sp. NPDC096540]|uniref:general stress protein n=1 Tax=Peribacillus sp. NPDC096540 TaxID=3390612 RepID=UPI003D08BE93
MDKRIISVYETGEEAIKAVEALQAQGYNRDDISVVAKDKEELRTVNEETGTKVEEGLAAGAATGGILAGAAVGAGTGGLAGTLIGLGIPEEEANRYETDVKNGKLLVLVDADERKAHSSYSGITETDETLTKSRPL